MKEGRAEHWKKISAEEKNNIIEWGKQGVGITEIVRKLDHKITKQRVKQILDAKNIPVTQIKRDKAQKEHHDKMFKKWGPKWQDKEWRCLLYTSPSPRD